MFKLWLTDRGGRQWAPAPNEPNKPNFGSRISLSHVTINVTTVTYSSHHFGNVQPVPERPGPDDTPARTIAIAFTVDAALMIHGIVNI